MSSLLILRRALLLVAAGLLPIGAIAFWHRGKLNLIDATVYTDPQCTCCKSYADYLDTHGFAVTLISTSDLTRINRQHGMPEAMDSCHTTLIGNYVVEGHVPVDVIQRLLTERPNLIGISLPGMPPGTPGMDGPKEGPWTIFAFAKSGWSVFTTV